MKKLSLIAFCLVLTLLLAACATAEPAPKTASSESRTEMAPAETTAAETEKAAETPAERSEAPAESESKETETAAKNETTAATEASQEGAAESETAAESQVETKAENASETKAEESQDETKAAESQDKAAAESSVTETTAKAADEEKEDIIKKSMSYKKLNDKEPVQEVLVKKDGTFLFQGWTIKDWKAFLAQEEKPILIDFWASWCGPCKQASPEIDKIAADYAGKVRVLKINSDYARKITQHYNFTGIPAFYLIYKGEKVNMWMGLTDTTMERIRTNLDKLLE